MCGSDEWRQAMREVILPWALNDTEVGDDVLEVGPGYGACTDVLSQTIPKLTSVEIDGELAAMLQDRFADPGGVEIVNADATEAHHVGDTYNPVDPAALCERLARAEFEHIDVRTDPYGWAVVAFKA